MNRDDIIRMAREASGGTVWWPINSDALERFAALVAAAERKPLTEEEIGLLTTDPRFAHIETPTLAEFARAVIAKVTGEKNESHLHN